MTRLKSYEQSMRGVLIAFLSLVLAILLSAVLPFAQLIAQRAALVSPPGQLDVIESNRVALDSYMIEWNSSIFALRHITVRFASVKCVMKPSASKRERPMRVANLPLRCGGVVAKVAADEVYSENATGKIARKLKDPNLTCLGEGLLLNNNRAFSLP